MEAQEFAAYTAGFWDGEGWLSIGVERGKEGRSDIHHIGIYITQRARHRAVLDLIQSTFGGTVTVRDTKVKGSENWAEQADWHIHTREQIERFCRAVQPYCIVKARQVAIALEYVTGFEVSPNLRDDLGRIRGRSLSVAEIERRERLRCELQEVNVRGAERTEKIERPRRVVAHVVRSKPAKSDPSTVSRGEKHYKALLTEETVRAIRTAYAAGETIATLARLYGTSWPTVKFVVQRKTWKHIE